MHADRYADLLKSLRTIEKPIVASLIRAVRSSPSLHATMATRHTAAEVGGSLDDFIDVTARRTAVRFLLRTVYVRVLEDLGVLVLPDAPEGAGRIRGQWGRAAFRDLAPRLGDRAYLAFVFRDLARDFPALFQQRDDELPLPDEDACKAAWELWHEQDETGAPRYRWNDGDGFDSQFLGDLYQDLDGDVRKRFALLQTPSFVASWMLDHTLDPALVEFDPEALRAAGETFRVLDPTCGSGHFLLGAWRRLARWWEAKGPDRWSAAERALDSVWGADLNPHAVDIAHFRLMLEVIAFTGVRDLDRLRGMEAHLHLAVMDTLIPWERGAHAAKQGDLFVASDRLSAYATPWERAANGQFLDRAFHVVVGNPPYITPKDAKKKLDYREFWPDSCYMRYALSAPFAERLFVLGAPGAFVAQITANSFMKRQFGMPLIESVFPKWDLTGVIDTAGAFIPGHGTPTVILFGRARTPVLNEVWAVLGKRGEPKKPHDPAQGLVWTAIRDAGASPDDTNPFVTAALIPRTELDFHPWSIGGGEARAIAEAVTGSATNLLHQTADRIGMMTILKQDDIYFGFPPAIPRSGHPTVTLVEGLTVRDYAVGDAAPVLFPYNPNRPKAPLELKRSEPAHQHYWSYRKLLRERTSTGFKTVIERGMAFYEYPFYFPSTYETANITFAFVATHNHFVLDRGGKVFKQSAPVIKLPPEATADDHLDLLGLLNSSTLGFWMRQVFHNKGYGAGAAGARTTADDWENFYEYDSTKLQQAPLTAHDRTTRIALAAALDAAAAERAAQMPRAVLALPGATPVAERLSDARAHYLALTERMVAVQEELDWLTYSSYGLIDPLPTVGPDDVETLAPGHRPFEIVAARADDEADPDEKSAWWSRHGHDRVTEIPARYQGAHRARLEARIAAIEADPRLQLLETFAFKRRWQTPDLHAEAKIAAEQWLLDRLEDLFATGALSTPRPYRLEAIATALQADVRVAEVAAVAEGTVSFDLPRLVLRLLDGQSIPDQPYRIYTDEGLRKRAHWQETWAAQDREDAGETVTVPLPPKYAATDFQKANFFKIRGKLDVPRERFITFQDAGPPAWGWNGWRDLDRAKAQVEALEAVRHDPTAPMPAPSHDDPRRCGATLGLWASLDDVRRWGDADVHDELRDHAREACGQTACPCPIVARWQEIGRDKAKPGKRAVEREEPEVTVEERTAVVARLKLAGRRGLSIEEAADAVVGGAERARVVLDTLVGRAEVVVNGKGKKARYGVPEAG